MFSWCVNKEEKNRVIYFLYLNQWNFLEVGNVLNLNSGHLAQIRLFKVK